MKLFYSPASPYARKVMVAAHEIGIADRIELVAKSADVPMARYNPLMKVPALVLDDGSTVIDSPVIAEYLDSLHDGRKLFPVSGAARWIALRLQALADGIAEANTLRRREAIRAETHRLPELVAVQALKIRQGLEQLERETAHFSEAPTIGEIAIACTIGYVDIRNPEEGWREYCPNLARWLEGFAKRPSMLATAPAA